MWEYNYLVPIREDELMHYGVKGMKWGVRRNRNDKLTSAKRSMKSARKEYNKAFKKGTTIRGAYGKNRDYHSKRIVETATNYTKAKDKYKAVKKEYRKDNPSIGSKAIKNVSSASKKMVNYQKDKVQRRGEQLQKSVDRFGVGGGVLNAYGNYAKKSIGSRAAAHLINAAANSYIRGNSAKYYRSKGVDYVRKAAIAGLSAKEYVDAYRFYGESVASAIYQYNKSKKK